MVALFSLTALVSALLLFSVQPMVAKMLLPILGGAPHVWNTAMVFYQAALLGGYYYAHLITSRLSLRRQQIVHGVLLFLPVIVLPIAYRADLEPSRGSNPIIWMLVVMATSVGLPFAILSATSPLLQTWLGRTKGSDPYFLYAASNIGSFVGLLAYPFLIEPNTHVKAQSVNWSLGYAVLVLLLLGCIVLTWRSGDQPAPVRAEHVAFPWSRRLRWLFLAFVPSSHFIGLTSYLTADIAVMPLLWVIPLAIYLLTMVLVFAKKPPIPHRVIVAIFPFALTGLVFLAATRLGGDKWIVFGAHFLMLFIGAMLCHGELAKDRPEPARLTEFFLWMSCGGVLGGIFNAIIAPAVFTQVIEYLVILVVLAFAMPSRDVDRSVRRIAMDFLLPGLVASLAMGFMWYQAKSGLKWFPLAPTIAIGISGVVVLLFLRRPLRFALGIAGMVLSGAYMYLYQHQVLFAARSFFGVYRVQKIGIEHDLYNGRILHGLQYFDPKFQQIPQTYYHPDGPLKEVLGAYPRPADAHVAVIGLGTGTMALWSRPGEAWTYYEIDPVVEKIARDPSLFTCLRDAKGKVNVEIGDARLRLKATDQKYDAILIDAFSSDAIPAHLMTREAFELYSQRLQPQGLLAVHISNRFLNLQPLVTALALERGWPTYVCDEVWEDTTKWPAGRARTVWAVTGPPNLDWSVFTKSKRWKLGQTKASVKAWTDGYSSLMPVLR